MKTESFEQEGDTDSRNSDNGCDVECTAARLQVLQARPNLANILCTLIISVAHFVYEHVYLRVLQS